MGLSTSDRDIGLVQENKGPNIFSSETDYGASLVYEALSEDIFAPRLMVSFSRKL